MQEVYAFAKVATQVVWLLALIAMLYYIVVLITKLHKTFRNSDEIHEMAIQRIVEQVREDMPMKINFSERRIIYAVADEIERRQKVRVKNDE